MVVVEETVTGGHRRELRVLWDGGELVKRDVYCRVDRVPGDAVRLGGSSSGSAVVFVSRRGSGYVVYVCSGGECYATDIIGGSREDVDGLEVEVCGESPG